MDANGATAQRIGESGEIARIGDAPIETAAGEHGEAGGRSDDGAHGHAIAVVQALERAQADEAARADNGPSMGMGGRFQWSGRGVRRL